MPDDVAPVTIFDRHWPGRPLPVMPGDFSQYVPQGFGISAGPIIRPWDDPMERLTGPDYYGFQERDFDPVRGAPLIEAIGGTVYFDESIERNDLTAMLRIMRVKVEERAYAVFAGAAENPVAERYLEQARIMSKRALRFLFGADKEAASLPDQPISLGECIAHFVDAQRHKWNEPDRAFSSRLAGAAGGDGDFAKEALAFGFMVEKWTVVGISNLEQGLGGNQIR